MSLVLQMLSEVKSSGAEAKATAAEKAQADKKWQFSADKTAFDSKVAMNGFTEGSAAIGGKVESMEKRISAIEGGATRSKWAGKGKQPVMHVQMSLRRGVDPLQQPGGDAWGTYLGRGRGQHRSHRR